MQLDAIGIVVTDLARAVTFYRLLGLDFPDPGPDDVHLEAKTASGVRVMLDHEGMVKSFVADWTEPRGQRVGMAFLCASPADVDAAYQRLVDAGFGGGKAPWDAVWGQRYAQIADADGNKVDLFASL
jgi:catechol 2,3-dioxygenase-like lactoylglutathione lyase family enzyme